MRLIKDLFDQALELEIGKKLVIPCNSTSQMHSVRVMLSRERTTFDRLPGIDFYIVITSSVENNSVILQKVPKLRFAYIMNTDGTVGGKIDLLAEKTKEDNIRYDFTIEAAKAIEKDRIITNMRKDGWAEDQIEDYFANPPSLKDPDKTSIIDVSEEGGSSE